LAADPTRQIEENVFLQPNVTFIITLVNERAINHYTKKSVQDSIIYLYTFQTISIF